MDLAFTPEEQQFREDIRAWVKDNLPADISHKVHNALRLSRDDKVMTIEEKNLEIQRMQEVVDVHCEAASEGEDQQ